MLWKVFATVLLVAVAVGIFVEHAVTNIQIRTIASARSGTTRGGAVALRGTITFAQDNRFILEDGTGRVELSTCPLWYRRVPLREGDCVTAVGEVMSNPSLHTRCDFVLSVYKVFRGGEVIQVRRGPGKPPWMSYRPPGAAAAL
ncbi:MAG TPA: hypothetical protein VMX94_03870 [Armatimonadota bacterium]|nr:hypothetical protein [Armatimonadota bacterium]